MVVGVAGMAVGAVVGDGAASVSGSPQARWSEPH